MPKSTKEQEQPEPLTPDETVGETTQEPSSETDSGATAVAETPADRTAGRRGLRRGRRKGTTDSTSTDAGAADAASTDAAATDAGASDAGAADAEAAPKGDRSEGKSSRKKRKASQDGAVAEDLSSSRSAAPAKSTGARTRLTGSRLAQVITALLVVAILLAVILLVQLIKGPGNGGKLAAQEDRGESARQAANTVIPKLYSYDYRQIDQNIAEQEQLTVGTINDQIRTQTAPALKQLTPKAKAIVQAVSVDSAVLDASGPDVQVLVFLNQAVNSNLLPAPRLDRNRIVATMRQVDGQWKVADIKAL